MPPRPRYTPEDIVNASVEVVRQDSFPALTARRAARELKCTVRPLYLAFESMDALRTAVLQKITEICIGYMLKEQAEEPFRAMGHGYFRFAQKEPNLYRALYLSDASPIRPGSPILKPILERMAASERLGGLPRESHERIITDLWVFTHGLTSLVISGQMDDTVEQPTERMSRVAQQFIDAERYRFENGSAS